MSGSRKIYYLEQQSSNWNSIEAPNNATEIFFDADNNLWAIATGIKIYRKAADSTEWQTIYSDTGTRNCYPKAVLDKEKTTAIIHSQSCTQESVTVYGLRLR